MNKEFQKFLKESKTTQDLRKALKLLQLPSDSSMEQPTTLADLKLNIEGEKMSDGLEKDSISQTKQS